MAIDASPREPTAAAARHQPRIGDFGFFVWGPDYSEGGFCWFGEEDTMQEATPNSGSPSVARVRRQRMSRAR